MQVYLVQIGQTRSKWVGSGKTFKNGSKLFLILVKWVGSETMLKKISKNVGAKKVYIKIA